MGSEFDNERIMSVINGLAKKATGGEGVEGGGGTSVPDHRTYSLHTKTTRKKPERPSTVKLGGASSLLSNPTSSHRSTPDASRYGHPGAASQVGSYTSSRASSHASSPASSQAPSGASSRCESPAVLSSDDPQRAAGSVSAQLPGSGAAAGADNTFKVPGTFDMLESRRLPAWPHAMPPDRQLVLQPVWRADGALRSGAAVAIAPVPSGAPHPYAVAMDPKKRTPMILGQGGFGTVLTCYADGGSAHGSAQAKTFAAKITATTGPYAVGDDGEEDIGSDCDGSSSVSGSTAASNNGAGDAFRSAWREILIHLSAGAYDPSTEHKAHSNIIGAFAGYAQANEYRLYMQLARGGDLANFILRHNEALTPDTVARVIETLATALEYLHGAVGVAMIDVKAANIFLLSPPVNGVLDPKMLQLGDFGMAAPLGPLTAGDREFYGRPGVVWGKNIAPELKRWSGWSPNRHALQTLEPPAHPRRMPSAVQPATAFTPAMDTYALGYVFWTMLNPRGCAPQDPPPQQVALTWSALEPLTSHAKLQVLQSAMWQRDPTKRLPNEDVIVWAKLLRCMAREQPLRGEVVA